MKVKFKCNMRVAQEKRCLFQTGSVYLSSGFSQAESISNQVVVAHAAK